MREGWRKSREKIICNDLAEAEKEEERCIRDRVKEFSVFREEPLETAEQELCELQNKNVNRETDRA